MSNREQTGWAQVAVLLPALAVALGAVAATAHGLFEVAVAARVPRGVAWLYPLITDGLALVAYAATRRLGLGGRRYAWLVVVLAAALSGLAQATYLASGVAAAASTTLRFGVGAWPAVAAAIVAHLLYLLAVEPGASSTSVAEPAPVLVADLVATAPPAPVASVSPALVVDSAESAEPGDELVVATPGGGDELVSQARDLVAKGAGRGQLVEKLGVTDYRAKQLLKDVRQPVNGHAR